MVEGNNREKQREGHFGERQMRQVSSQPSGWLRGVLRTLALPQAEPDPPSPSPPQAARTRFYLLISLCRLVS